MRIAILTTTPEDARTSRAGALVHALVPHLAERHDLRLFVESGREGGAVAGLALRDVARLDPLGVDQIVFAVGNDAASGYALPLVRRTGGVAALLDWCLADAARAAYPGLTAGGALARWLAVREGAHPAEGAEPALNRSVVRHADAFLVPSDELRARVLEDRNDPTPTAVFDPGSDPAAVAARWSEALEHFPKHRVARRSILGSFVDAVRRRAASASGTPREAR